MSDRRISIGGPYFEDFAVGQVFDDAPALTVTAGHTALHQALFGDRLRLPLDACLGAAVTGRVHVAAFAVREPEDVAVLDWRPLGLMA